MDCEHWLLMAGLPLDLSNPEHFTQAVRNIQHVHDQTPERVRRAARDWYPRVHDAIGNSVRGTGLSHAQGSGMTAAVSPGMDWEAHNLPGIKELTHLKGAQWEAIHRSAAQPHGSRRSAEAADALKGYSISRAPDSNLVKAHRIMEGEDIDTVLNRRTAPKTNSFYHNNEEPEDPNGPVTIDGRAYDIGTNSMRGWTSNRGISSAGLASGKTTRYEHFENAYRAAAHGRDIEVPNKMQAITWEGGKHVEMSTPTKSGAPRKKGPARTGQGYF